MNPIEATRLHSTENAATTALTPLQDPTIGWEEAEKLEPEPQSATLGKPYSLRSNQKELPPTTYEARLDLFGKRFLKAGGFASILDTPFERMIGDFRLSEVRYLGNNPPSEKQKRMLADYGYTREENSSYTGMITLRREETWHISQLAQGNQTAFYATAGAAREIPVNQFCATERTRFISCELDPGKQDCLRSFVIDLCHADLSQMPLDQFTQRIRQNPSALRFKCSLQNPPSLEQQAVLFNNGFPLLLPHPEDGGVFQAERLNRVPENQYHATRYRPGFATVTAEDPARADRENLSISFVNDPLPEIDLTEAEKAEFNNILNGMPEAHSVLLPAHSGVSFGLHALLWEHGYTQARYPWPEKMANGKYQPIFRLERSATEVSGEHVLPTQQVQTREEKEAIALAIEGDRSIRLASRYMRRSNKPLTSADQFTNEDLQRVFNQYTEKLYQGDPLKLEERLTFLGKLRVALEDRYAQHAQRASDPSLPLSYLRV
ncbi:MAG: hypothetical protein V4623_08170 [Pseudomonadota bacterium]